MNRLKKKYKSHEIQKKKKELSDFKFDFQNQTQMDYLHNNIKIEEIENNTEKLKARIETTK